MGCRPKEEGSNPCQDVEDVGPYQWYRSVSQTVVQAVVSHRLDSIACVVSVLDLELATRASRHMAVIGLTTHVRGPIKAHVRSLEDSALAVGLAYFVRGEAQAGALPQSHNFT